MTSSYRDGLIDPATWDFIQATERFYPPDAVGLTIPEQRAVYDRMCVAFRMARPEGVRVEERPIAGVPCRIYDSAPATMTLVYCHGGGFVVGGSTATTMSAPRSAPRPAIGSSVSITGWCRNIRTRPPMRMRWWWRPRSLAR